MEDTVKVCGPRANAPTVWLDDGAWKCGGCFRVMLRRARTCLCGAPCPPGDLVIPS